MTVEEVAASLKVLALKDGRYGTGDSAEDLLLKAKAWHRALPVNMAAEEFDRFAERIMQTGAQVTPASLRRMFAEAITPKHRQGLDHVPTPAEPAPPKPAIGSGPRRALDPPGDPSRPLTGPQTTALIDQLGLIKVRPKQGAAAVLTVRCPHCFARPHRPCVTPGTGRVLTRSPYHPAREEAWRDATQGEDGGNPTEETP